MFSNDDKMKKGRKKIDIVKNIFNVLEKEKEVVISRFVSEGYNNKTTWEYIELINWIIDNGKRIKIKKIGSRIKTLIIEEK